MVAIETELRAPLSCSKVVHGLGGFMKSAVLEIMDLEGRNYTRYYVNAAVSRTETRKFGGDKDARTRTFFQEMKKKRYQTQIRKDRVSGSVSVEKPRK